MSIEKRHVYISEPEPIKEIKEIKREEVRKSFHSSGETNSVVLTAGKKVIQGLTIPADKPDFSIMEKEGKLLRKVLKPPLEAKPPYIVECANCGERFRTENLCGAVCWSCGFKHSCTETVIVGGS